MKMQRAFVRVMTTIFALLIPLSGYAADAGEAKIYGKTYGQWSAEWWQWAHSLPASIVPHPVLDEGEVDCSLGQKPPVYFLAGLAATEIVDPPVILTGERTCTVPQGVALFFPLVNARFMNEPEDDICRDDPEDPATARPCTEAEKRAILDYAVVGARNICGASATLDGEPVVMLVTGRTQSPAFTIVAEADDPFGVVEGTVDEEVVSDGYWMMLPPLRKGQHELTFRGSFCLPQDDENPYSPLEPFFGLEIEYQLNVVPGG